jgi:hypothetical protein
MVAATERHVLQHRQFNCSTLLVTSFNLSIALRQDMLDGWGLGHVTHLSRCEWSVLRGAAGRPRRLSLNFLKQERHKLEAYRCAGGLAYCAGNAVPEGVRAAG